MLRLAWQPNGEWLAWEGVGRGKLGRHRAPVPSGIAPRDDRLRTIARRRDGQRRAIGLTLPERRPERKVCRLKVATFFVTSEAGTRGAHHGSVAPHGGLETSLVEPRGLVLEWRGAEILSEIV